ncbi:MAG TPA: hypothetical protein VFU13_21390 [Steroidobacteraceae bacterium]|nr:hypothetical protein [Steroidobacteraceae bacterium]
MYILKKSPRTLGLDEPIRHESHKTPVSRRDFIAQGFRTGPAIVAGGAILSALMGRPARAMTEPLEEFARDICAITSGAGKVPFICFDLAGGANLNGSEILLGAAGDPLNFLSTQGYATLGLPGNMTPGSANAASPTNNFVNTEFGAPWHSDGAMLRGMLASTQAATRANTNAFGIAARSENDTGNNPHNPMYGINRIGADGELLTLIGSQNTDSGGNSMAPAALINPAARPTKVDRASDVTGLVDTGELSSMFPAATSGPNDAIYVLESMTRLGHRKTDLIDPRLASGGEDEVLRELVKCGYVKSTYLADRFRTPATLNPDLDPDIKGPTGIFTDAEYAADGEFRKTAAVMKMVINGYAGAGTVTMGGYDYHGQGRNTGENRNFRAGRCIGACLEYARRMNKPLMIYVFSDGSLSASGAPNMTVDGRGKLDWMSDNQSTAASIVMVHRPTGRVAFRNDARRQIGSMTPAGAVATSSSPAANAVNLLVETVLLNYMALHGEEANFDQPAFFPRHGLGGVAARDALTILAPVCQGTISNPA